MATADVSGDDGGTVSHNPGVEVRAGVTRGRHKEERGESTAP